MEIRRTYITVESAEAHRASLLEEGGDRVGVMLRDGATAPFAEDGDTAA